MATLVVALAAALSLASIALPADITANVSVKVFCGISVDMTPIEFGSVDPGSTSIDVSRTITNTGTSGMTDCKYEISGTDWSSSPPGFTMDSEQTDYKCNEGSGIDCLILTSFKDLPTTSGEGPETYLALNSGVTETTDFHVSIPLNQPSSTYIQTITVTLV